MTDHIQKTIDDASVELAKHEASVINTKKLINQLCVFAGHAVRFTDAELSPSTGGGTVLVIKKNSFYGRPLATCIREYLETREKSGVVKEGSLNEIVGALREGGYNLSQNSDDENEQRRFVAISLGKNPASFHRLPSGDWGLSDWYDEKTKRGRPPKMPESKPSKDDDESSDSANDEAQPKSSLAASSEDKK